ncbi:MAG: hypothetical protein A3F53_02505 [Candidatus Zambryskibacteria bacterium RIFCSPHIGHO2_12_FULL_48_10]|nr:MAG: hypothetical protein A3F53_02505 [Candidatus Zambryskibacteria bacterium RIFCSPHIGHO2_12_FULL_48_10]
MITNYKSRVLSPIQPRIHPAEKMRRKAMDTQNADHPIRREIQRMCGEYQFTAHFSEATEELKNFPHISGLVAVKCLLLKDNKPLAEGCGYAILTRINKSIERTAMVCVNASFLSACNNACKIWDSLRLEAPALTGPKGLGEAYRMPEEGADDLATARQVDYLKQLIQINLDDPEREQRLTEVDQLTKSEASQAIASFAH